MVFVAGPVVGLAGPAGSAARGFGLDLADPAGVSGSSRARSCSTMCSAWPCPRGHSATSGGST
jgi:hypothetical protein